MTILFICRQRGLRTSTATASITLMWRQHGHVVGCDRSVGRRTTALPPFFVRTLPDPRLLLRRESGVYGPDKTLSGSQPGRNGPIARPSNFPWSVVAK